MNVTFYCREIFGSEFPLKDGNKRSFLMGGEEEEEERDKDKLS